MSRWTERAKEDASQMLSNGKSVEEIIEKYGMSRSSVILLKYSLLDNKDRIECQICHNKMKQITVKHLNTHGLSLEEYKKQFPNFPLFTKKRSDAYKSFRSPSKGKTYEEIYGQEEALIKKNKISVSQIGRSCPRLAGTGITGTRKDTNTFARSIYEANIDRIFILENKKYIDELSINMKRFELIKKNGEKISYCPDRLDEDGLFQKDTYLEVKGYMFPEDWEKIQLFREQYKNHKLLIISKDKDYLDIDYSELEKRYKNKISLWEDDRQNYKTRPDLYVIDYQTPEYISFYQKNYPNHINISISDLHAIFIANRCLSFNRISIGEDPYIEIVELVAISNKRHGASRKSSGDYNYELWKVTTIDKKIFYVTNQNKTNLFYCYKENKFDELMSFFFDNNISGLKYGRKYNKTHEYIDNDLWDSADDHKKKVLQLINDKMKHRGAWDSERVVDIILNKSEKAKLGSFYDYEEWSVFCNKGNKAHYILTNFNNATSEFKLYDVDHLDQE